jgi:hypothetical protein
MYFTLFYTAKSNFAPGLPVFNRWLADLIQFAEPPLYVILDGIVIDSEGKGLSELVRKRCDFLAHIPMRGEITSLNVSVAAALVMCEAFRQRNL